MTLIDWKCAADLRRELGDEDFVEVVGLFLDEAQEAVDKLSAGPPESDLEELLHFLKGSALNLGFMAFSELCQNGEVRARAGDAGTVNLGEIVTCYEDSKNHFLDAGERGIS